jgi:hypothetical protein
MGLWFPTTVNAVQRAFIFAHELGHNAGADHVEPTAAESIMEEHFNDGKDGFAKLSKDEFLSYINSVSCIGTVVAPDPPGDVCANGEILVEIKLKTDEKAAETVRSLSRSSSRLMKRQRKRLWLVGWR